MANGSEPTGMGLVIATGLAIAAVVGLYANDAMPRRSGPAPQTAISWPSWDSSSSYDRSYDSTPQPQAAQSTGYPQQGAAPTDSRYQPNAQGSAYPQQTQPQQNEPQQGYPQQQPYPQQGAPQQPAQPNNDPRDVPDENGAPTQQQYQQPQGSPPPGD
jgi:hypothetical protein